MKKKMIALLMAMGIVVGVTGCNYANVEKTYDPENENIGSMFVCVEKASIWMVVYDKETKVMYAVSDGSYTYGNFTMLVNADGTPKLYEGE